MAAQGVPSAARVPYGARGDFPPAGDMGDKALYVDPSDNQALWQVQSGNWVRIGAGTAPAPAPAGVPALHGPYVVDFGDIPHDGDTKTLWTPRVGDVLLALWGDPAAALQIQQAGGDPVDGGLAFGTAAEPTLFAATAWLIAAPVGPYTGSTPPLLFAGADPVQVRYVANGDGDLTAGHAEIYALVARAVAP